MRNEPSTVGSERSRRTTLATLRSALARDRRRAAVAAGAFALAAVALRTALRVLHNVPFDPVATPPALRSGLAVLTPLVAALAVVVLALAATAASVRVGLLFAGVFGLLATVRPTATLPAVVALVAGGGLALLGGLGRPSSYPDARRTAVAAGLLAGVAVSLASTTGIVDAGLRGIGAVATLAAYFGVGVRAEGDRIALVGGAVAALAVLAASLLSPFVLGSALLVEFAVVGAPLLLVALAAGGLVAALAAALRRGETALAVGAALLLLAGIPVTVPRALAVLLGGSLALLDLQRVAAPREVTA